MTALIYYFIEIEQSNARKIIVLFFATEEKNYLYIFAYIV